MLRLSGFIFGAAVAILMLAAFVFAPVREVAVTLVTEISGIIFDLVDVSQTEQSDNSSELVIIPAVTQEKEKQPEPASFEEAAALTSSVSQNRALSPEESTTAGQILDIAPPATKKTEVLATYSTSDVKGMLSTAPDAQQKVVSANSHSTGDGNETDAESIVWQPVWHAFRNELSATGFADHLQRLTNQEYRVRRISPWSYQVELAYVDERQRDTLLHEIQAKTGLSLVEAQP